MKNITKRLSVILIMSVLVFVVKAQTAIPYLPQMDDFGGTAASTAAFLPPSSDYTLEVQGTADTEISIAGGIYTYTPTVTGAVRFAQKGGKVYVYEGNEYKATLTPGVVPATYPDIFSEANSAAGQTGIYNPANLLINPGFETIPNNDWFVYNADGASVSIVNIGTSGTSIRTQNKIEGANALLFHGGAQYLTQQLGAGKIKPNNAYKIAYKYFTNATGSQGGAVVRAQFGTTEKAEDIAITPTHTTPTSHINVVDVVEYVITGSEVDINNPVWFAIKRTEGTGTGGAQKLEWYDNLTIVEATSISTGITGVSSAVYLEGSAYAPTVALAGDDYFDMTSYIVNPSFNNGITGWTSTTGAQNNTTATNQNVGAFEGTMPFWENWNGNAYTGKMFQVINGLPAGKYTLQIGVFANNGGEGLFVYANEFETAVSNASTPANFTVDAVILGNSLEIGLNIKSGTNNWVGIDNVKLYYLGDVEEPVITVSTSLLLFSESVTNKTFTVSGINLTDDITFSTGSVAGITFNPSSIDKDDDDLATGITVTATFNLTAEGSATASGNITVSTAGVDSKSIPIVTSKDSECFTPLASGNLAPDPTFIDATQMLGWGSRSLVIDITKAYCGAGVGFSNGGSYDQRILWEGNTSYLVRAMVYANGTDVKLGVYGIGKSDVEGVPVDKNNWELVEYVFTTGASPTTTGGVFFNNAGATGAYIDNLEVYKVWVVTFNSNEGSAVDPQYVIDETKAVAPAAPEKGSDTFVGWFSDEALETPWDFDTAVSADMTLYAKWDPASGVENLNAQKFELLTVANGLTVKTGSAMELKVISVTGQIIKSINVATGDTFIALPAGVYIVNGVKALVK